MDKKWNRKLGTSKKEQGIITPPPPRYKKLKNGKLKCHCLFRGKDLWQECYPHIFWRKQQEMLNEMIKKFQEEAKKEVKDGKNNKPKGEDTLPSTQKESN